jgi:putative transposase
MEYQHDRPSVHLLVYHLIFCPNYRRALLGGPVKKRREQIIHEIVHEHQWQLIELAIQPDHVHLCVRTLPSTLPSDIPGLSKGRSSRLLRQEFAHSRRWPVLWSPSYFLSTAGHVSSETIAQYIQQQSEHEEVPASSPAPNKERPCIPVLERTGLSWPSYVRGGKGVFRSLPGWNRRVGSSACATSVSSCCF